MNGVCELSFTGMSPELVISEIEYLTGEDLSEWQKYAIRYVKTATSGKGNPQ